MAELDFRSEALRGASRFGMSQIQVNLTVLLDGLDEYQLGQDNDWYHRNAHLNKDVDDIHPAPSVGWEEVVGWLAGEGYSAAEIDWIEAVFAGSLDSLDLLLFEIGRAVESQQTSGLVPQICEKQREAMERMLPVAKTKQIRV